MDLHDQVLTFVLRLLDLSQIRHTGGTMNWRTLFLVAAMMGSANLWAEDNAATENADSAKQEATEKEASPSQGSSVECTLGSEKRQIEIRPDGSGCQVAYTKGGEESIVANAKHDVSYCEQTLDKIKGNLEKAGYTCQ